MGILYYSKRNFRALLFPRVCRICATATAAARANQKKREKQNNQSKVDLKKKYIARLLVA
jgi:hypothetical protein